MDTSILNVDESKQWIDRARWIDARPGEQGRKAYAESHIEGALHADLDLDLAASATHPEHGGRHPLPELDVWCKRLGEWGIDVSTVVIVYDDQSGANAAARLWWMLRAVGHHHVAVLDGGWKEALRVELPLAQKVPHISSKPPYPARRWLMPTVNMDAVRRISLDSSCRIIDVRSKERYEGIHEPIDPIAGHIPGAGNLPYNENLQSNGTFRSRDELRELYTSFLNGVPADRVVVHCGSGVTACHTLLAMESAGLPGGALYVGSWSEWCRNP